MKKGFTLVELLAVVLIVALLMGVGLPQYRKAVEKSRFVEAETMLRTIYDSSERLAGEFGYRSYQELLDAKGASQSNYYMERFDMFDKDWLPAGCEMVSRGIANGMNCSRFKYRVSVQGNNGRYYVAAGLKSGANKKTYVLLDRQTQELYCQPKESTYTAFCDILGLEPLNVGMNFVNN